MGRQLSRPFDHPDLQGAGSTKEDVLKIFVSTGTNTIKLLASVTVKYGCNLKMAGFWPSLLQLDGRVLQLL